MVRDLSERPEDGGHAMVFTALDEKQLYFSINQTFHQMKE
jgi:hypothetical protein